MITEFCDPRRSNPPESQGNIPEISSYEHPKAHKSTASEGHTRDNELQCRIIGWAYNIVHTCKQNQQAKKAEEKVLFGEDGMREYS